MDTSLDQSSSVLGSSTIQPRRESPIQRSFKECVKLSDQLTSLSNSLNLVSEIRYKFFDEVTSRLRLWGADTGAATWSLDHTLRKSSRVKQQVLILLSGLKDEFQTALNYNPQILRQYEEIAKDELRPPECEREIDSPSSSVYEASIDRPRSIQNIGDNINEILLSLSDLVPVLRNPAPQDIYKEESVSSEELKEIDVAMFMFPKASSRLIQKLAHANWARRQEFAKARSILQKLNVNQAAHKFDYAAQAKGVKILYETTINRKLNTSSAYLPKNQVHRQGTTLSGESVVTGTMTDPDTIFSRVTHVAENSANSTISSEVPIRLKRYLVPDPPVELKPGREFTCPYCLQDLLVGVDISHYEDWQRHIFADLEPYMCTFDDCLLGDRTFGVRDDWFRHELDSHRTIVIWFCQTCMKEFNNSEALGDHLEEIHSVKLSPSQLTLLGPMCERKSQALISDQPCAICRFVCSNVEMLKAHVAIHFEQLSLTSINFEDGSGDEVSPIKMDGNTSENEHKKERLECFLHELRENAFAKEQDGDEENEFQSDSGSCLIGNSIEGASVRNEYQQNSQALLAGSSRRVESKLEVEAYRAKVERYLEEQSKIFQGGSESEFTSLKSYDVKSESMFEPRGSIESLRSIRTLHPPRSQSFVGRGKELEKIDHIFSQNGRICVVSGAGGMGKSATAAEYTYKFEHNYDYIFWVQAETPVSCADTFCRIATHSGFNHDEIIRDHEGLITVASKFLKHTGKRWLLVFDNVEEYSALQKFMPLDLADTKGSILITTRNVKLLPDSELHSQIELGVLDLKDCQRILLTSTGENPKDMRTHPEYQLSAEIAKYAGRLPLALSHIAGYIQQSRCSLEDFVELWQERSRNTSHYPPTKDGAVLSHTEKTLEIVWNIGLREVTIDARELLNILAFLDSDTIHKDLLVDEHLEPELDFLNSNEKFRYKRMTSELARRRLIAIKSDDGQDILSIHRSLQSKILKDLNKDLQNRERVFKQACLLVRKKFPTTSPIQVPEPKNWPAYIKYIPHILSLQKAFTESEITLEPSVEFARLLSDGGMSLWERAGDSGSLELLKAAESILNEINSDNDMLKANINIIIAILIQKHGFTQIPESLHRIESALHTRLAYRENTPRDKYTKEDEILLYNSRSDYGFALLQYNNFIEAEPIFTNCLAKYQEWGTEEEIPYEYSKYYHCMAWCSVYRHDFETALKFAEVSVNFTISATGPKSPSTNEWKFNQACILLQAGDVDRALHLHTEVLEARLELHGASWYQTSQSYYAVGALRAMLGDFPAAELCMREALSNEHLHPEVALARLQFHLSQILEKQNKNNDEAVDLKKKARAVLDRVLPLNPLEGVPDKHELALFDHLQPLFGGARFTGRLLLQYVC